MISLMRKRAIEPMEAAKPPVTHIVYGHLIHDRSARGLCGEPAWALPAAQHICPVDCSCGCQECAMCAALAYEVQA